MSATSKGAALEREVKNLLLSRGYNAIRSSASSSPVDVYAWSPTGEQYWIQCKCSPNAMGPGEWNTFLAFCRHFSAVPVLATRTKRPKGRGLVLTFYVLDDYKDGIRGKAQPMHPIRL